MMNWKAILSRRRNIFAGTSSTSSMTRWTMMTRFLGRFPRMTRWSGVMSCLRLVLETLKRPQVTCRLSVQGRSKRMVLKGTYMYNLATKGCTISLLSKLDPSPYQEIRFECASLISKMEATLKNTLFNYVIISLLPITAKPESKQPACCDSITA